MWPSLSAANSIADVANWFFIGSLVVGVVSTILIVWMAGVKEGYWEKDRRESAERIAELSTQAEQLRKDSAEAKKETASTQLELQRLKSWRMVDGNTFKAELADVTPPTRVEILYVPECSDCFMVAGMFQALLNDMRWPCTFSELKKLDPPPYDWMKEFPAVMQHHANPTGISVVTNKVGEFNEKSKVALLIRTIARSTQGINNMQWSRDELMPDDVIRIVVAPKI